VKPQRLPIALLALAAVLAGCGQRQTPISPDPAAINSASGRTASLAASGSEAIGNYTVRYDGKTFTGGNSTFTYTVIGTGPGPGINHFVIEVPSCAGALVASSPNQGVLGTDSNSGIFGVKWGNLSIGPSESATFTVTFAGDVSERLDRVSIKSGGNVGVAVLPGPCQGFYIRGKVFVDPNADGVRNATNEPGILAGVTVSLVSGLQVETQVTDSQGNYSFLKLPGTYTVRVDASTPASDFNERLASSFGATTATSTVVTTGPDLNSVDFGYKPNSKKIVSDFDNGVLSSNGVPAGFWIKAFKAAIKGDSFGGFNATSLRALLGQIEGYLFPTPYQFNDGTDLQEALAILSGNPGDSFGDLYQQLFVAELNDAAGKGIVADPAFQDVLLSWAESLIVGGISTATTGIASTGRATPRGWDVIQATGADEFTQATTVVKKINNARGGGGSPD
jgi:hypothetical protein